MYNIKYLIGENMIKIDKKHILIFSIIFIILGCYMFFFKKENFTNYNIKSCINSLTCTKNAFYSIAFGGEFESKAKNKKAVIHKWNKQKIKIAHYSSGKNTHMLTLLAKYLKLMSLYTSIKFEFSNKDPDILLLFVDNYDNSIDELKPTLESYLGKNYNYNNLKNNYNSNCYVNLTFNNDSNNLIKSVVVIKNTLDAVMLSACIQEEITQGLGLTNDNKHLSYTLFNDSDISLNLTKLDFLLTNILYHKKIKSGMSRADIDQIFFDIYHELKF